MLGLRWTGEASRVTGYVAGTAVIQLEGDGGLGDSGGGGETWMDLGLILEMGLMGLSEGYIEGGWVDERVEAES